VLTTLCRAAHPLVFQYHKARDDRPVPKVISLTLVNHSKENLQRELLQELYRPDVLEDLLKESELVVARRKEAVSKVQALNKAEECVLPVLSQR
jgi:hypothetical protein